MKVVKLIFLLFIISLSGVVLGQTELEIKTSGKYIYSWAFDEEEEIAMEKAKIGLLDTIFISLLRESAIDQTDTIFIKVIDHFEKKVGLKWMALAFADKSDVKIKLENRQKLKVIPVIIGDQTASSMKNATPSPKESNSSSENTSDDENEDAHLKNLSTGNSILDELLILRDANSLQDQLVKLKYDLKLNFGSKANYPDDSGCYIFIVDAQTKEVVAVYDKGTGSRKNFYTNSIDKDYISKYKGNYFIYVVLN